jgi:cytochrome c biogenesis protein CcmG/thiol:disulfide interchange protein DsbE
MSDDLAGGGTVRPAGVLRGLSRPRKIVIAVSTCCLVALALILAAGSGGGSSQASAGQPAAKQFTLHALGRPGVVSLSQYAGRPVIVNFFASWCGPCQKETPLLARFYRARHGRVAIIGIDVNDSAAAAARFVRRAGSSYPIGTDPTAATATGYGVVAIPQTFFLDAGHHIVKRSFGAVTQADLTAGLARMS